MVAVIKIPRSMHRVFNYNENKVKEGVAECIGAENYPLNAEDMSLNIKLKFLLKRMELNENVKRNSVHISLNFDPSESEISNEKLMEIASVYMDKLGFGEQPFLVYRHYDAGHPHCHVLTTNIQADGSRIDLHHLGIRKSEPARKEIEKMFGLVVAGDRARQEAFQLKPIDVRKAQYGRLATKTAITNVLNAVLDKYKYTSLPELNAVLGLYNVKADRGSENSRIYQDGGLVYRILDEEGKPVGVPIKASGLYNKPTLKYLQTKFAGNLVRRGPYKARIRNAVDMALMGRQTPSVQDLVATLEKQGISAVLRQNGAGLIYGITYVDHTTHSVFNGSTLGKSYSAKGLLERCTPDSVSEQNLRRDLSALKPLTDSGPEHENRAWDTSRSPLRSSAAASDLLDAMLQPESVPDYVSGHFKRKRKKRKKRNLGNSL